MYTKDFKINVSGIFKNSLNSSIECVLGVSITFVSEKYSFPSTTACGNFDTAWLEFAE